MPGSPPGPRGHRWTRRRLPTRRSMWPPRRPLLHLVDLSQHRRLHRRVRDSQLGEESRHQPAVVDPDGERAHPDPGEDVVDHGRHLGVVTQTERASPDHVDVALVELSKASPLRSLAPVDPLDLIALEGKRQFVLVFCDVPGEGHREIETHGQIGKTVLLDRSGRLHEVDLSLRLPSRLGEKDFGAFEDRGLDLDESVALIGRGMTSAIRTALVGGGSESSEYPGRGARGDHGRGVSCRRAGPGGG